MGTAGLCLIAMLAWPSGAGASSPDSQKPIRIHVLTVGPGEGLFTRFGHIALVVEDHRGRALVYNYGTFGFDDPALLLTYARGRLTFWLSRSSLSRSLRLYREEDRAVTLRYLDLDPEQAHELARRLATNAQPANRDYAYKHYLDNCCTRVRDLLDEITGRALSTGRNAEPTGRTYRDWTAACLDGLPVLRSMILFVLGPAIDKPITRWDEQFLPEVLVADLDQIRLEPDGRTMVSARRVLSERKAPPVHTYVPIADWLVMIVFFSVLGAGLILPLAVGAKRWSRRLCGLGLLGWGLVGGLGGLALLLFWTATEHLDTHCNENLLLFPCTHLWLLGPGFALLCRARLKEGTARVIAWYLLGCLVLVGLDVALKLGPFIQRNWGFLLFAAACHLAALLSVQRAVRARPMPVEPEDPDGAVSA
ncbi:MAG: DUF4105 domain-containing protein [Deltaproteobacteria bacterium]|nr:DUF4105 domain-containing protein [Deltaproteobacteria bacterium]